MSRTAMLLGREAVERLEQATVAVFGLGGIQLLCIGVLGEYIGKIYSEVKGRPRYVVEAFLDE